MSHLITNVLAIWTPGPLEMIFVLGVMVLLFGRRLPEIARNIGRSLAELKKGVKEIENTKNDVEEDIKEAIKADS